MGAGAENGLRPRPPHSLSCGSVWTGSAARLLWAGRGAGVDAPGRTNLTGARRRLGSQPRSSTLASRRPTANPPGLEWEPHKPQQGLSVPVHPTPFHLPRQLSVPTQWSWECWSHSPRTGGKQVTIFCRQPWRGTGTDGKTAWPCAGGNLQQAVLADSHSGSRTQVHYLQEALPDKVQPKLWPVSCCYWKIPAHKQLRGTPKGL